MRELRTALKTGKTSTTKYERLLREWVCCTQVAVQASNAGRMWVEVGKRWGKFFQENACNPCSLLQKHHCKPRTRTRASKTQRI